MLLTATQTLMGVALILGLRFPRAAAWALLTLFVVQFPIVSTHGRLLLCGIYTAVAVAGLIVNRRHLVPTVRAPFLGKNDPPHRSPAPLGQRPKPAPPRDH